MCLDIVFKDTIKPKKGYKVGKRVFDSSTKIFMFSYMRGETHFDVWVQSEYLTRGAKSSGFHVEDGMLKQKQDPYGYFPGFHILTRLEDAELLWKKKNDDYRNASGDEYLEDKYSIFECEYAGILAEGFESWNMSMTNPIRVDVAAMIKINSNPLCL